MSGPEDAHPGVDLLAESEDQAALRQLARDVATREVAPRAHQADEEGEVPAELRKALAAAFAGSRQPDGSYRQDNSFRYLIARA